MRMFTGLSEGGLGQLYHFVKDPINILKYKLRDRPLKSRYTFVVNHTNGEIKVLNVLKG